MTIDKKHSVEIPDYLWKFFQEQSGKKNPATEIRNVLIVHMMERAKSEPEFNDIKKKLESEMETLVGQKIIYGDYEGVILTQPSPSSINGKLRVKVKLLDAGETFVDLDRLEFD